MLRLSESQVVPWELLACSSDWGHLTISIAQRRAAVKKVSVTRSAVEE